MLNIKDIQDDCKKSANMVSTSSSTEKLAIFIKIQLKYAAEVKEMFLSNDQPMKKTAKDMIIWMTSQLDKEVRQTCVENGNVSMRHVMNDVWNSDLLTPEECKLYLQSNSLITLYNKEIFKENTKNNKKSINNKGLKKQKISRVKISC